MTFIFDFLKMFGNILPKVIKIIYFFVIVQLLDFVMSGSCVKTNSGIPTLSLHNENASIFYFFVFGTEYE